MKRFAKRAVWLLTGVLGLALTLAAHTWFGKPLSINWFYDRSFVKAGIESPELLTYVGMLEQFGLRGHNGKWDDASIAAQNREFARLKSEYDVFKRYDVKDLASHQDRVSHAVFDHYMQDQLKGERWRFHDHPINQLFGVQSNAPNLLTQTQPLTNAADVENYLKRLDAMPEKYTQVLESIKLREQKGVVPPKFAVEKVIEQMQGFIKGGAKENPLYVAFNTKLAKIAALSSAERDAFAARAQSSIETRVIPAYQGLINHFEGLRAKATRNDGVWALPDGDAFYQYKVESQTTTTMKADEIHALGLSEVARIRVEMDALLKQIGIADGPLPQRMANLGKRPDLIYPNTDEGRAQVIKDYNTIIDEMTAVLPTQFGRLPKAKLEVKRVPEFSEKTAPGAYYQMPSADGTRPGAFFANLRDANETPKFSMRTLAYHEAVPGHHMQIAIAQELSGLPIFRNFVGFTAYAEGWALYAERLAWEMGFQKAPEDNLGRLQDEMLRAVRLVVDTGLHAKRWTREQAIAYMMDNTGMPEPATVTEIERYIVDPGQALGYKIGMIKILELREKAKVALGAKYDARAFHDTVLASGSLPLTVLETVVNEFIAAAKQKG